MSDQPVNRFGGRAPDEIRPVKIVRDYLPFAEGSVLMQVGATQVICAATVERKVPSWLRGANQGWITAEYSMLPRSTAVRTVREVAKGRPKGRTSEIQRLIGRSLRSVTDLKKMGGENTIILDCDVVNADGGTRTAAVTGAYVALHDALCYMREKGIIADLPLSEVVAGVSVGLVNGCACIDLDFEEDSKAEVDMNIIMTAKKQIIEIQGTAERATFSRASLDSMLDLAETGIAELVARQREVLPADR